MNCVCCGSAAVTVRPEVMARGYRRFHCRDCGCQFNERNAGVLNRAGLPSDVIAFVVFCRLRYRLTLRDLSEIMALRGIEVSHEAVRDWKAKLLPVMGDDLRKRRHGLRRGSDASWHVDETYLKVCGRWAYLYRAIDRDGDLIDVMLSEHRDMKAAKAFFRSARAVMGFGPDRVTTDGHSSYPRAIRTMLGKNVQHRTSALSRTVAASRAGSAACAASGIMTRPAASAGSTANSEISPAPAVVTTRSFPPTSVASASREAPVLHSGSCRRMPRQALIKNKQNSGAKADRTSATHW